MERGAENGEMEDGSLRRVAGEEVRYEYRYRLVWVCVCLSGGGWGDCFVPSLVRW